MANKHRRSTSDNYAEALAMKEAGFSLADIGTAIGCTRQYAHKLLKNGPPSDAAASTIASTSAVNRWTVRQHRYSGALLEGKSQKDAALDAVEPGEITTGAAETWASRQMGNDKFQEGFAAMLAEAGLSEQELAKVHVENLRAAKVVGFDRDAQGRKRPIEHPDYGVRQRAVDSGWDLHGRRRSQGDQDYGNVVIRINAATAKVWANLRGDGTLPDGVEVVSNPIDIRPEEEPRQIEGIAKPAEAEESEPPDQA